MKQFNIMEMRDITYLTWCWCPDKNKDLNEMRDNYRCLGRKYRKDFCLQQKKILGDQNKY